MATDGGISKAAASKLVQGVFDNMAAALAQGEKISFPGFGSFEVRDRAAKESRNPRTGEKIMVPARKAVAFKPGKTLKDTVNK